MKNLKLAAGFAGALGMLMVASGVASAGAGDGNVGMTILGARVDSDATLLNGAGATGTIKLGTGTYEVQFSRNVTNCFYSAVSFFNSVPIFVEPRSGNPNGVFIEFTTLGSTTTNPTLTDTQFYLTVYCSK